MKKGIGTRLYEINDKLGVHNVTNKLAKAAGKKDCGCKKRAEKIDNVQERITELFQGNKNK